MIHFFPYFFMAYTLLYYIHRRRRHYKILKRPACDMSSTLLFLTYLQNIRLTCTHTKKNMNIYIININFICVCVQLNKKMKMPKKKVVYNTRRNNIWRRVCNVKVIKFRLTDDIFSFRSGFYLCKCTQ